MIFRYPPKYPSFSKVVKYLQVDLFPWLQSLETGLLKLSLIDNFDSFRAESLSIANGATVSIPNGFKQGLNGVVPSQRIITRQSGNGHVTDGTWSTDFVELINNGPADTVVDVIYLWDGTNNSKSPILTGA
ncbi:MAG: hypothetical protein DRN30_04405 [Thermoplasmata archaeon]|nr:MAG: hypothetical protein DRN30_04405 [Thermoplasmata archaeon]